jgi:hypothetical protein
MTSAPYPTPEQRLERLRRLRAVLAAVARAEKPFSLRVWGVPPMGDSTVERCGTVHCAAGWAMQDPWFREQGLVAHDLGFPLVEVDDGELGLKGGPALWYFFGLTRRECADVFFLGQQAGATTVTAADQVRLLGRIIAHYVRQARS